MAELLELLLLMLSSLAASGQLHQCERQCEYPVQPKVCEYIFEVAWYTTMSKACYSCPKVQQDCSRPDCIAADGVERAVLAVNKSMPGPTIRVCKGDTIKVKVINKMQNDEGLSIHWHGIYQRGTTYMDGAVLLTQCPIAAHTSFTYQFEANPPGTHWWHAHSGLQRGDGIAGPLIVDRPPATDPHSNAYDTDSSQHIAIFTDWVHKSYFEKFLFHHYSSGSNKAESYLINGKGYFKTNSSEERNFRTPFETFTVTKGKRHRFRVINNAILFCPTELTIDHHTLTIIASDGVDIEPYDVTTLVTHGGERFDFVVNANQNISNYWMTVQGMADCINQTGYAIVRYNGSKEENPTTVKLLASNPSYKLLNPLNQKANDQNKTVVDLDMKYSEDYPVVPQLESKFPDKVYFLGFDFMKINNPEFNDPKLYSIDKTKGLYTPMINNVSFKFPEYPLLTQPQDVDSESICNPEAGNINSINANKFCDGKYCSCAYVIDVELGKLVELVLYDEGFTFTAGHPFHLHGHHFAVVAMDKVAENISTPVMKELYNNGSIDYKLKNAPMKDTVIVPDGGYTVVRFVADNPGVWFFHCHLEFHQSIGMGLVIRVGYPDIQSPPNDFPRCGTWSSAATKHSSSILWPLLLMLLYILH